MMILNTLSHVDFLEYARFKLGTELTRTILNSVHALSSGDLNPDELIDIKAETLDSLIKSAHSVLRKKNAFRPRRFDMIKLLDDLMWNDWNWGPEWKYCAICFESTDNTFHESVCLKDVLLYLR